MLVSIFPGCPRDFDRRVTSCSRFAAPTTRSTNSSNGATISGRAAVMLSNTTAVWCPAKLSPRDRRSIGAGMPLSPSTSQSRHGIANAVILTVFVFACSMTLASCAHHPAQHAFTTRHKVGSAPVQTRGTRTHPEQFRYANVKTHWPDAALLSPQPAPDCEFKGANVEAMDATELARLKIEYERQCYQNAERAARDRLGLLQGAVRHMRD